MPTEPKVIKPVTSPSPLESAPNKEEIVDIARGSVTPGAPITVASSKKKKSRKNKRAVVIMQDGNSEGASSISSTSITTPEAMDNRISGSTVDQILEKNPALGRAKVEGMLRQMKLEEKLTGMALGHKDMTRYKFWSTQPVARFNEEEAQKPDGPVREKNPEVVPAQGVGLLDGFEWVTMDLNDEKQLSEVYGLLCAHYVEDSEAMFRFNYSISFLKWALKSPGWIPEWHVGVRVTESRKLVAFISGIPVNLKVRANTIRCSGINFLCIHKKLRSKRLAPVLIKEMARRCNMENVWNAIYTTGVVLPKPISTCRYFHRSLDWLKLYEVGFSPLPHNITKARQITKFHLPPRTSTRGLREIQAKDVDATHELLKRYLWRFDMAPDFGREETEHWLLHNDSGVEGRVVFTYVVEDEGRITDFFSFYALESSVIVSSKHKLIRAAYLSYYATEAAFKESLDTKKELKIRLNMLVNDALIIAKRLNFDVFNALTFLDNTLFLKDQKFNPGDGQLHYYLFNWRTAHIKGGIDEENNIDEENGSGIGIVMV